MVKIYLKIIVFVIIIISVIPAYANDSVIVTTLTGQNTSGYVDGNLDDAVFNSPSGITINKNGDILLADTQNHLIRKISNEKVTTVAGDFDSYDNFGQPVGGFIDGNVKKARFNMPTDMAVDSKGNIFVADRGNNVIRKITNGKVYTFAGTGESGYKNGRHDKAMFNSPYGITIDSKDNILVADTFNHVIRKITPNGYVSTICGSYNKGVGGYIDGELSKSEFNEPYDLAVNKNEIYVVDSGNQCIRKIKNNEVTTYAGNPEEKISGTLYFRGSFKNGTNSKANFNFPKGISIYNNKIIVSDSMNNRIRMIQGELVRTLTGNGNYGDLDSSLQNSEFNNPYGIAIKNNLLYVCDKNNNKIRTAPLDNIEYFTDREDIIREYNIIPNDNNIQVYLDKEEVYFPDIQPFVEYNRVNIPIRFICEKWGGKVLWDKDNSCVIINKGNKDYIFCPDNDNTFIKKSRTFISTEDMEKTFPFRAEFFKELNALIITTVKE